MTNTLNQFILTAAERDEAMGYNVAFTRIDPRPVDNASPGVGINLNDAATDYDPGEVVPLTGMFVAPKNIVDDPTYQQHMPGLITYLLGKPWALLEDETVFAPYTGP